MLSRSAGQTVFDAGSGWDAAAILAELVAFDMHLRAIRGAASMLRQQGRGNAHQIAALTQAWVHRNIPFLPEKMETFIRPDEVLLRRAPGGDCDDHARLVAALLAAAGVPSRLVILARDDHPLHVTAQAQIRGQWTWLETTVPARLGEHPHAAAIRAGVTRRDITDAPAEVPMPSSTEQIRKWQELLKDLGFYDGPIDGQGRAPAMLAAVRSFQERANEAGEILTVDGLIGPRTGAAAERAARRSYAPAAQLGDVTERDPSDPIYKGLPPGIDKAFLQELRKYCDEYDIAPEAALAIFEHESGIGTTMSNHVTAQNKTTRAAGLNMFISPPAGFPGTLDDYAKLKPIENLPYIFTFWKSLAGTKDPVTLLQWNFVPASMGRGQSDDYVIVRKGGDRYRGLEDLFYAHNVGMDKDRNGLITRGDLRRALAGNLASARYKRVLAAYHATEPARSFLLPATLAIPALLLAIVKAAPYIAAVL